MNGTTFIEQDSKNRKMHKGFYIDIMCLNNAHSNFFYRYLQYLSARFLTAHTLAIRGYETKNLIKKITLFCFRIMITKNIKMRLINFVRSLNKKNTNYVGHFFGRAPFNKSYFSKHYLSKPRRVEFSGLKLPVPSLVEEYLTVRYGDKYMEMPSEKTKSMYPSHFIYANPNIDYKLYEKNRNE